MEYTELGRTGILVSRIGFGSAAIGGYDYGAVNEADSISAIQRALDLGINFFDTADVYGLGQAEEVLKRALGPRRREVIIATKVGVAWDAGGRTWRDNSPAYIVSAVEASLRRLELETLPLCQLHWLDRKTPISDSLGALAALQEQGKIRFIGGSNFDVPDVVAAHDAARIESIQLPCSLLERQALPVLAACRDGYGMSGIVYNCLGQGLLAGKFTASASFQGSDRRRRSALFRGEKLALGVAAGQQLRELGARLGRTAAQVALRWTLHQPGVTVALAGAKTAAQVEENTGACGWVLEAHAVDVLTRIGYHADGDVPARGRRAGVR